eukprot:TRINITY_DN45988_c0_g1_i1.p1 TRINITY_DN45988_c0_g1~~TRINITY_DN45988_c0_g1_i1.p1  ORF type:complete len:338 (-),score=56.99 TRINITY_DN45988_c0_g1_i1:349-1362(-)
MCIRDSFWGGGVAYWLSFYFRQSQASWMVVLAVNLALISRSKYTILTPCPLLSNLVGWGFPLISVVVGLATVDSWTSVAPDIAKYDVSCWYHSDSQLYPAIGCDFVTILIFAAIHVYLFRFDTGRRMTKATLLLKKPLLEEETSDRVSTGRRPTSSSSSHSDPVSEPMSQRAMQELSAKKEFDDKVQLKFSTRVKFLIWIGILRIAVQLTLQTQMVANADPDGSYAEELLVAVMLVDGSGILTAAAILCRNPIVNKAGREIRDIWHKLLGVSDFAEEVPWLGSFASGATVPSSQLHPAHAGRRSGASDLTLNYVAPPWVPKRDNDQEPADASERVDI